MTLRYVPILMGVFGPIMTILTHLYTISVKRGVGKHGSTVAVSWIYLLIKALINSIFRI